MGTERRTGNSVLGRGPLSVSCLHKGLNKKQSPQKVEHIPRHLWEKYQSIQANGLSSPFFQALGSFHNYLVLFIFLSTTSAQEPAKAPRCLIQHTQTHLTCTLSPSLFPTLPSPLPISHWVLSPLLEQHPLPSTDPIPAHLSGAASRKPPDSLHL